MNYQEQIFRWAVSAKGELDNLLFIIRDKGIRHLVRPIAVASAALFAAYWLVSAPSAARLGRIESKLAAISVTSQYLERYKLLDSQLRAFRAMLPDSKDRGAWLIDAVRKAMREEGISPTSWSSVEEKEQNGVIFTSLTIGCRARYGQIASWIARMEHSQYFLRVTSLTMKKINSDMGVNEVTATVVTAASKEGASL